MNFPYGWRRRPALAVLELRCRRCDLPSLRLQGCQKFQPLSNLLARRRLDVDPEEFAVPAELVPSVLTAFAALPAPPVLLELLRPPTLAGSGAPSAELAPAEPTPCAPAGDDAAPAAAPLDDAPPADRDPASTSTAALRESRHGGQQGRDENQFA